MLARLLASTNAGTLSSDWIPALRAKQAAQPFEQIKGIVRTIGDLPAEAKWHPLGGGRSNQVWHVTYGDTQIVCKLYDQRNASSFFPNDPMAEVAALEHLGDTGLAPRLISHSETTVGHIVLYAYVPGRLWRPGQPGLAATLRELHQSTPPRVSRVAPKGSAEIAAQARQLLDDCSGEMSRQIAALAPQTKVAAKVRTAFIHGDLVPNNVVMNEGCATLIDWQCPAVGDPCDDIATLFSPAMSLLYGDTLPDRSDIDAFFTEYGDPKLKDRFDALRPFFHWRMAAYCLWKSERGAADYLKGLDAELEALTEIQCA